MPGYDFDGANDGLNFGQDASIDDLNPYVWAYWVDRDVENQYEHIFSKFKNPGGAWSQFQRNDAGTPYVVRLEEYSWDGNLGRWEGDTQIRASDPPRHIVITYDPGTDDCQIFVDGVAESVTQLNTPSGSYTDSNSAGDLLMGLTSTNGQDFDGRAACMIYDDAFWTATEANRAMWWGRPYGGILMYHPFWTDKVANEGTATADCSVTGATQSSAFVFPTVRPGTTMLGAGVGW